jgi:hypothetical protein
MTRAARRPSTTVSAAMGASASWTAYASSAKQDDAGKAVDNRRPIGAKLETGQQLMHDSIGLNVSGEKQDLSSTNDECCLALISVVNNRNEPSKIVGIIIN